MGHYKITVAYDGTDYFGWQVQKEKLSVAQKLQDVFEAVFDKKILILGASRTDAGVHAMGQVASFGVDLDIASNKMMRAWNNVLPPEIVIRSLKEVPEQFNPFINVVSKTYWYHFFLEHPLPFAARYGWHYRYPVNIEKLQQCLDVFVGTHDFRSFCSGDDLPNTVRRIDKVDVKFVPEYNAYRIEIIGPKFLRYMIRRIVGACIEVASRNHLAIEDIKRVLDAKNPEHTLPTAPAKGLMLYKIIYAEDIIS
jgi:tRNA pseudouridine38-40 synthase